VNFLRYVALSIAALVVVGASRAAAQVYAPVPNGAVAAMPGAAPGVDGTGNPFLRRGPSRVAQIQQQSLPAAVPAPPPQAVMPIRYDDQIQPAAYEQPLAAAVPQSVPPAVAPVPQPFVPPADAAPLSPPQSLHGVALLTAADPNEHPLAPIIRWADDALLQAQGLQDYTCTFIKRERVDGRLQEQEVMYAKVRHQPYSVYLQFLAPSDKKGQEALYVEGRNQGRLLAHPVGWQQAFVGTLSLAPNDPQAMAGNLHPITDFGVRRLLEPYRNALVNESRYGEINARIIPGAQVGDRACVCIELSHPIRRAEFKFHLTRLYVDAELNLPIHYESYDWPSQPGEAPLLIEDYTYQGLRPNVGLSDADFDSKNPNYRF
jgi:hypothetical protein